MFQKGEKVEVLWDRRGWLPGTFERYVPGYAGEDFNRLIVNMDSFRDNSGAGYHPDCVRIPKQERITHAP